MANKMILLIGPSGSGKTATAEYLQKTYGLAAVASYTTRPPRNPKENGHTFITEEEFDRLQDIVAYTKFANYRYCVTKEQIDNSDVYIVDLYGAQTLKELYKGEKEFLVFYLNVSPEMCAERMLARGDGGLEVANRLENDKTAFLNWNSILSNLYSNFCVMEPNTVENIGEDIWKHFSENSAQVVLYTTGCPVCKALKNALDKAGITYDENSDIEEMKKLGISSVPVLSVDNRLLKAQEAFEYIKKLQ